MKTKSFIKPIVVVASMTVLTSTIGLYCWKQENRPPIMEIYVFAFKSGRSVFIRTPEDRRILVDGGPNSEVIRQISEILPFYSRRIDTIIATNDSGKNVGGLIDVVERYEVGNVYLPAHTLRSLSLASSSDQIYETFIEVAKDKLLNIEELARGRVISLDSHSAMQILFPADPADFAYSKSSAPEVLFSITYDNNRLLFAGDATTKIQKNIASSTRATQKADVLIVSHSALPQSFATEFVDVFQPQNLIFSKTPRDTPPKASPKPSTKSKPKKDPLEYLSPENRYNTKERGGVKIELGGKAVTIKDI